MSPMAGDGLAHWLPETEPAVAGTTIASILREAARRAPQTTALVEPDGEGRRWSYETLRTDAERLAGALGAQLDPGARVAVCAPSLPEALLLTYAAAMAGLVLVPVNPALRDRELDHVLRQSGTVAVFSVVDHRGEDVLGRLRRLAPNLEELRLLWPIDDLEGFCRAAPAPVPLSDPDPDAVAQIVYTSGTTGTPKGARLTHRGMTNAARFGAVRFGIGPGDVYVDTMPTYHVGGQVVAFQICQQLATCVLVGAFEPGAVLRLLERERATLTVGVPTMLVALLEHPDFAGRDLRTLRAVSSGGSVVPPALVTRIEQALGVQVTVVFGQSEACGFISQTHNGDAAVDKAETLGQPLAHVEARVVDTERATTVAQGVPGELQVRGPNVMAGYHDLPGETAEALSADGWLRTGDLVTMDGRGYLRICGRVKDMITTGGENVYPAEVEAVLTSHPDVALAAVIGLPDDHWGERVVAVVRPRAGAEPDQAAIRAWLRERLAPYKVPKEVVVSDELPLTATGKVQKFVLKARLGERA